MAAVSWPAGLPQYHFIGTTLSKPVSVIASENTTGPPQYRKLTQWEADKLFVETPLLLTGFQVATFWTFWDNINQGRDAFNWTRPDTDTQCEYRFRGSNGQVQPPVFTLVRGDSDDDDRIWQTSISLEVVGAP